jgi:hypothetical protein
VTVNLPYDINIAREAEVITEISLGLMQEPFVRIASGVLCDLDLCTCSRRGIVIGDSVIHITVVVEKVVCTSEYARPYPSGRIFCRAIDTNIRCDEMSGNVLCFGGNDKGGNRKDK